ncbi:hypothetical protein [Alicyclobacillus dauci]|uniref:Uncharacterized protein n=1 Tax=Alicyclobacillus dauci TaxID=1475485 RepID=A0ABY6Z0E6_9BACL|nr:hypothetical protein [Alicyclobacillus dauci]WAH36334.1 hypothetical protein NZD86_19205 [Alicyclobacillus dauci]WAH39398.1 hypothetical protein NZD86_23850 [Alicyclobacillus dauci]
MGGLLLTAKLPLQMNFLAFAIPSVIAASALVFIQQQYGFGMPRLRNGKALELEAN